MVSIGLVSDTHVPHDLKELPVALFERLAGVDLILHAGDLNDPAILDALERLAPVQAVRGNWHVLTPWPNDHCLPWYLDLKIEGQRIVVSHGHLSSLNSMTEKIWLLTPKHHARVNRQTVKRLSRAFPGANVYVFGHSHQALIERRGGALFVNPGAACRTRGQTASVARLTVTPERVDAEILPL